MMPSRRLALLALGLAGAAFGQGLFGFTPTDPAAVAIVQLAHDTSLFQRSDLSRREVRLRSDAASQEIWKRGRAYLASHDQGPEWAEVVLSLRIRVPEYIIEPLPSSDQAGGDAGFRFDEDARQRTRDEINRLLEKLRMDETALPQQRATATWILLMRDLEQSREVAEVDKVQADLEAFAKGDYDPNALQLTQTNILRRYEEMGLSVYEAALQRFATSSPLLRTVAEQARRDLDRKRNAAERIKFTAIDGRDVDLASLKGKVVLVDFWATWCGPCVAELPNIKDVYAKYHERGFEIIGITLENAALKPSDSAEQVEAKLKKSKDVLAEFVQRNRMEWPQYFDGKFWKGDLPTYFNLRGIPAMLLFDRDGKLASTFARGPNLEKEVKRLLSPAP